VAGPQLGAVRIDSGDLPVIVRQVRDQLDRLGAKGTKIVVTSDLDEYTIAGLGSAPVNAYGVGTAVVTGSGHPAAGLVYKLVAKKTDGGSWQAVHKTSAGKSNAGGAKQAARKLSRGIAVSEEIFLGPADKDPALRPLTVEIMRGGDAVIESNPVKALTQAREHHRLAMAELPADASRLAAGDAVIPTVFHEATQ
jgi:nicotinate phosphoribosyltransferase